MHDLEGKKANELECSDFFHIEKTCHIPITKSSHIFIITYFRQKDNLHLPVILNYRCLTEDQALFNPKRHTSSIFALYMQALT